MANVLDGPRREIRRIFHDGIPHWVSVSADGSELVLGDGRRIDEAAVTYIPPCDRMNIGDVVEVEVTGVGRLTNTVAESPAPHNLVGAQAVGAGGR